MRYFWATIEHKWFVLLASFKTGLPLWLAITHDWSKFSRAELSAYDRQFFGDKRDPQGFALAWLHHQNNNDHHWQWWITRKGMGINDECLPMSDVAILHMVTDWVAIRRAQFKTWDSSKWKRPISLYDAKVHPETKKKVESIIEKIG